MCMLYFCSRLLPGTLYGLDMLGCEVHVDLVSTEQDLGIVTLV